MAEFQSMLQNLKRAEARIKSQLGAVQGAISALESTVVSKITRKPRRGRKRGSMMSKETRAKMAAAQKRRWAKAKK